MFRTVVGSHEDGGWEGQNRGMLRTVGGSLQDIGVYLEYNGKFL